MMSLSESRQKVLSSPAQISGAREYLELNQLELAVAAGVGRTTAVAFDRGIFVRKEATQVRQSWCAARRESARVTTSSRFQ